MKNLEHNDLVTLFRLNVYFMALELKQCAKVKALLKLIKQI